MSGLETYNVTWDRPGRGSKDSMPIGNGDITANVWTEPGGNICFYIGKADSWSEAARLLKIGKVRIQISPNSFDTDGQFLQTLKLKESEVVIQNGSGDNVFAMRIWVDANYPVIRVETEGKGDFDILVTNELWRGKPRWYPQNKEVMQSNNWNFYYSPMPEPVESADTVMEMENGIGWYHRNETSPYREILEYQNIEEFYTREQDPYQNRTFGAWIGGDNLIRKDSVTLEGIGRRSCRFSVYVHTAVTETADEWERELKSIAAMDAAVRGRETSAAKETEKTAAKKDETDWESARKKHRAWWDTFWDRSWIYVSGDAEAETVTRGYLLQRYLQAIQGRGAYPIKFNGGTVTFDYRGENPDHRDWGAPYWFQNTRHLYWNMLASGDFELMEPFFTMYRNALDMQKKITNKYYGHEGAFFPETMNFFGTYSLMDYYWGDMTPHRDVEPRNKYVRYYWQGALELSYMMLEYYEYTEDKAFLAETAVPFCEQIILFYDRHFPRGEDGRLLIAPSHALETYWDDVSNPTDQVAGLRAVIGRLMQLEGGRITAGQRENWERLYQELPEIPLGTGENGDFLEAAETFGKQRYNNENPELYAVFPYKLYGLGKENPEAALRAWEKRISTFNYCWSQNGIHAAYLGLAEEAKKAVISHFSNSASDVRFPAFWDMANDWMPDLDNGGSAMTALQAMLVQCDGEQIRTLPAWPKEWSVDAKLHVIGRRTIHIHYEAGKEVQADCEISVMKALQNEGIYGGKNENKKNTAGSSMKRGVEKKKG